MFSQSSRHVLLGRMVLHLEIAKEEGMNAVQDRREGKTDHLELENLKTMERINTWYELRIKNLIMSYNYSTACHDVRPLTTTKYGSCLIE